MYHVKVDKAVEFGLGGRRSYYIVLYNAGLYYIIVIGLISIIMMPIWQRLQITIFLIFFGHFIINVFFYFFATM